MKRKEPAMFETPFTIVGNIITDLAYAVVDPRIRYD